MICQYVASEDLENPKDQPRKLNWFRVKGNSKKTFNCISISSVAVHEKINKSNLPVCVSSTIHIRKRLIWCISVTSVQVECCRIERVRP